MPLDMSISKTFGPGTGVEVTGLLAVWYAHTHAPECSPRLSWGRLVSTVADTGQYSAVPGIRMAGGRLQLKVTTNWVPGNTLAPDCVRVKLPSVPPPLSGYTTPGL